MTSFDIEKILRREGAPKAFAKAVAAACRAAGLFDRCQADIDQQEEEEQLIEIKNLLTQSISIWR